MQPILIFTIDIKIKKCSNKKYNKKILKRLNNDKYSFFARCGLTHSYIVDLQTLSNLLSNLSDLLKKIHITKINFNNY